MSREDVLNRLKRDVQTAVQIELATIPIYLYTYYSIKRSKRSGENITDNSLFANKAGGRTMSVAVEEMLHLSSNVYFALFGEPPVIYGLSTRSAIRAKARTTRSGSTAARRNCRTNTSS